MPLHDVHASGGESLSFPSSSAEDFDYTLKSGDYVVQ